jgi:hypothetical protein
LSSSATIGVIVGAIVLFVLVLAFVYYYSVVKMDSLRSVKELQDWIWRDNSPIHINVNLHGAGYTDNPMKVGKVSGGSRPVSSVLKDPVPEGFLEYPSEDDI